MLRNVVCVKDASSIILSLDPSEEKDIEKTNQGAKEDEQENNTEQ